MAKILFYEILFLYFLKLSQTIFKLRQKRQKYIYIFDNYSKIITIFEKVQHRNFTMSIGNDRDKQQTLLAKKKKKNTARQKVSVKNENTFIYLKSILFKKIQDR